MEPKQTIQPFIHRLEIKAKGGETVCVKANFDDGALTNAMSMTKFNTIKHRLGHYEPSSRLLRMADGSIVRPAATWHGTMEMEGVQVQGSFEVFESGGNWEFLLGKPLLAAFHAIHEYTNDTVTIGNGGLTATLKNQANLVTKAQDNENLPETTMKERGDPKESEDTLPQREVVTEPNISDERPVDIQFIDNPNVHKETTQAYQENPQNTSLGVTEINIDSIKDENSVFTRLTDSLEAREGRRNNQTGQNWTRLKR